MITTSVVGNLFLDGDDVEVAVTHDAKSAPTITLSGRGASSVVEKKLTRRKKQRVGFGRLPVDFYVAALSVNGQEIARMDLGVVPRRKFAGDPEAHSLGIWAKCGLKYHRVDCCADQVLIGAPGETRWDDNSKFADGRGGWACGGEINNYPDLFRTNPEEIVAWHRQAASNAEEATNWFAAVFHLELLDTLLSDDAKVASRLQHVQSQIKKGDPEPEPLSERIPFRDPNAPVNLIDLSQYYNSVLTNSWQATTTENNTLSVLPQGIQTFGDVS
ncbi:MAG: hypothetical protein QF886_21300, partial [Planctomycetota bacterium]|nr:hypothetical protein [Planctomycetota bacterium]